MTAPKQGRSSRNTTPYRIAIVGAGSVGIALAKRLTVAGHLVTISNSRGPDTLRRQEQETGARAVEVTRAAAEADVVVLAVPVASILSLRPLLQASLRSSTILIDAGNYYPSRDGRIEALDKGTPDTVWVSQNSSVPVVKAFNNIIADNIVISARPKGSPERVTLPVSGDNSKALEAVMTLVEDTGFDAYNAGLLADTWRFQPGQPAYCTEPTLGQLQKLLAKANLDQGPLNRDKSRAIFERLPENYSPRILLRVSRLFAGLDKWDIRSWLAAVAFAFTVLRALVTGRRAV